MNNSLRENRLKKDFFFLKEKIRSTYLTDDAVLLPCFDNSTNFNDALRDMRSFSILMKGPPNGPYEEGVFKFDVIVPEEYPMVPPKVTCATTIYHQNITNSYVCVETLQSGWSPALGLYQLFMSIYAVMFTPNNHTIAKQITEKDLEKHDKHVSKATEITKKYAIYNPA